MLRPGLFTLLLLLATVQLPAALLQWLGSSAAVWHGNITNSDRPSDRLSALQWETELAGNLSRQLSGSMIATAGLHTGLELWPEYEGLNAIALGPILGLQYKAGLGPQAWVLSAQATGDWVNVQESDRSGLAGQLQLEVRKRVGDAWQFFLGTERARYDARSQAFSNSGRENYLRGEWQWSERWRIGVELRQRAGIVVSYTTPPRPDLVQAGKVLTLVDTFERSSPLLAYYFPADTTSGSVEISRMLGTASALFVRYEYRDTTHNNLRYLNQRSTVGVIQRF